MPQAQRAAIRLLPLLNEPHRREDQLLGLLAHHQVQNDRDADEHRTEHQ